MIVGILSDTHGRIPGTSAALAALRQAGAEYYIHCGDVGAEPILDLMAGLPLVFVWGNTDYDQEELSRYARKIGLDCRGELADLELDGRRIAVTHGDRTDILRQIVTGRKHEFILHGHTHVARDQVLSGIRYINPGAVHRSPRPSVAVLDTQSQAVRFIPITTSDGRREERTETDD
ncbi:MAG TPA: metallophosphoesterase family protein [Tepidisphaeraceae bacterium]|nr:metallophosphoesterase family protein [Tepidisphaeraceae bacterium]